MSSKLDRYRGTIPPKVTPPESLTTSSTAPKRAAKKSKEDTKAYKSETRCGAGQCKVESSTSVEGWTIDPQAHPVCPKHAAEHRMLKLCQHIDRSLLWTLPLLAPMTSLLVTTCLCLAKRIAHVLPTAVSTGATASQKLVHISLTREDLSVLCAAITGLRGNPIITPITVPWYRWCARCWKKWEKLNGDGTAAVGANPTRRRTVVRAPRVEGVPGEGQAAARHVAG